MAIFSQNTVSSEKVSVALLNEPDLYTSGDRVRGRVIISTHKWRQMNVEVLLICEEHAELDPDQSEVPDFENRRMTIAGETVDGEPEYDADEDSDEEFTHENEAGVFPFELRLIDDLHSPYLLPSFETDCGCLVNAIRWFVEVRITYKNKTTFLDRDILVIPTRPKPTSLQQRLTKKELIMRVDEDADSSSSSASSSASSASSSVSSSPRSSPPRSRRSSLRNSHKSTKGIALRSAKDLAPWRTGGEAEETAGPNTYLLPDQRDWTQNTAIASLQPGGDYETWITGVLEVPAFGLNHMRLLLTISQPHLVVITHLSVQLVMEVKACVRGQVSVFPVTEELASCALNAFSPTGHMLDLSSYLASCRAEHACPAFNGKWLKMRHRLRVGITFEAVHRRKCRRVMILSEDVNIMPPRVSELVIDAPPSYTPTVTHTHPSDSASPHSLAPSSSAHRRRRELNGCNGAREIEATGLGLNSYHRNIDTTR